MRGATAVLGLALTLAVAGCSKPAAHTDAAAASPPASAPAEAAPSAPAAAPPQATDTAAAVPAAPTASAAAPATPAAPAVVRFSPGDYPAQERRVAALIANAETRDTLGETRQIAARAEAQRARCTSVACIKGSYAAEEARLRKWEGSGDVR